MKTIKAESHNPTSMNNLKWKLISALLLAITLSMSWYNLTYVFAPDLSYNTVLTEGSLNKCASFIGSVDAGTYYIHNAVTGDLHTSGTSWVTLAEEVTNTQFASAGGLFFLTAGTYELTSTWDILSGNVTIIGESWETVLFSDTSTNFNMIMVGDGVTSVDSVRLESLTINGNYPEKSADLTSGIGGMVRLRDTIDFKMINCYVHHGRGCGVSSDRLDDQLYSQILDCKFDFFLCATECDSGTDFITANYTTISRNVFTNCDNDAIWVAESFHCLITDNACDLSGFGKWGIGLSYSDAGGFLGSGHCKVSGNTIWASDMGIYLYAEDSIYNTITDNTIYRIDNATGDGLHTTGIKLYGDGTRGYPSYNIITGNTLDGMLYAGSTGILLDTIQVHHNIVVGNIVSHFAANITDNGDDNVVQGNIA